MDADDAEAPDLLGFVILEILERAGRPLSAAEVAEEVARLALLGQGIAAGLSGRGH
jgi:hypothetical protein